MKVTAGHTAKDKICLFRVEADSWEFLDVQ